MTTCAQFKKVTVITDPNNPELDLICRAESHGNIAFRQICSDGFVYLIEINVEPEEAIHAVLE